MRLLGERPCPLAIKLEALDYLTQAGTYLETAKSFTEGRPKREGVTVN